MRILLTGGAGFIGSHVAEHLLQRGHEVAIIDNLSTGNRENVPREAAFCEADIRSAKDVEEVFARFEPEVLSHQAAQMDVRRSVAEPGFDAEVNIVGTLRLLEGCVRHGVSKVVFASTGGAIYGEQQQFPAPEDHPQYPLSPYGVSKLAGERYLHFYCEQYGLPYTVLRYANVYGPRQDPHGEAGVVAIFCGNLAAGDASRINGSGEQTRDYTYVGDVARANVLAVEGESPAGAYNIGTAVETSVNRLYDLLQNVSGKDLLPQHGPAKPGEQLRSSVDSSSAARVFGWRPQVALEEGLRETFWSFETS
ncbi:SDR family oxidoreductase [soil metagenome]